MKLAVDILYRLKKFDWALIGGLAVLAAASLIGLASVNQPFFWRQLLWFGLAFFIIFLGGQIDWRWLRGQAWFRQGIYWLSIALLTASNLQSETIRGTKSWIVVGDFQFEPAELAKLALILVFAHFFSKRYVTAWHGKNIITSFLYAALPAGLVMLHPDLGAAVVIGALWLCFLLMSGINKKRLAIGFIAALGCLFLLWSFVLRPYQKDRLVSFVFPERDPLGASYNVIQSKIAIGSAGFLGKGFGKGTQTQLRFLPEAHTDFLFAALVEEWGLLGGFAVVLTFLFVLSRLVRIGLGAMDNSSRFIALGAGFLLLIHFFINVGSNLGLVPVTGLPFPFFSYGGSSILTLAILIGIMERIKLESSI